MKKSFLKRVMAAAVAVPVALTQTMLCTSFAADADVDTAADAAEKTAITVDTFMDVLADPTVNVPEQLGEGYWVQDSTWEEKVATAVTDLYGTTCTLDTAKLADAVEGDADSVAGILRRVLMNEGVTATAVVGDNTVVITVDADYVPMAVTEKAAELGVTLDTAAIAADAQVIITVNTAELDAKKVSAAAVVMIEGQAVDAAAAFAYAYSKVAAVAAEAEKAGVADEFAPVVAEYKANLDRAQNALTKASGKTVNKTYTAADVDTLYAAIAAEVDNDKMPATFDEAMANGTALNIANEVLAQLNAAIEDSAYTVSVTAADVTAAADKLSDITATVNVANGEGMATVEATAEDEITTEEFETLYNYFVEYEAARGNAIVENTFKTVKVVDVEATGTAAYFAGEAILNVQREITYDVLPEESTTTTTETTVGSDTTDPTDTTEPTDTTDPSDTTTEPTDTTDPSDTTTEPTDTSATESTTSDSETTDPAGTETTTVDTTTGSETTTTESETTTSDSETTTTESETTTTESETTTTESETTTTESETTTSESESTEDTTTTTTSEVTVITVTAKTESFYLSHDTHEFTAEELIESIGIVVNGTDGVNGWTNVVEPDMSLVTFGLTDEGADMALTPHTVFTEYGEAYVACPIYIYYDGELVDAVANVYVGVKGDANLDGSANAKDSSNILIYAANKAAGLDAALTDGTDEVLERFAYFLGDVNAESKDNGATATIEGGDAGLNAKDSSCILIYAARVAAGLIDTSTPEGIAAGWAEIIG